MMALLKSASKELLGLFVEDEFLAVGILCVVAGALILSKVLLIHPLSVGLALLIGCLAVLVAGVWRTAMAHRIKVSIHVCTGGGQPEQAEQH